MTIRIISAAEVRQVLGVDECIDLMRHALTLVARDSTLQPLRTALALPGGDRILGLMPGYTAQPEWLGIKVISVFSGKHRGALGSHRGLVVLFDATSGAPVAILEGGEITTIRTAAATAVATDVLARKDAAVLAVFGCGNQARAHLRAVSRVRQFKRVLVWGRNAVQARRLCQEMESELGCMVEPMDDLRRAVESADVLCTVTAATTPFVQGRWLRAGQHLNVVGSSIPTTSEIDAQAVARARFFVDYRESAMKLAGEFLMAKAAGVVDDTHVLGSVGDVLIERIAGRTSEQEITLFKSLGMVCEDLLAADFVLRESTRRELGVVLGW